MTPEQRAWETIRLVLNALGLDPRRVENVLGPGHPDVDYSQGNIELKALAEFPKRANTPVSIETFTGEQAGWLGKRWEAGGLCWLLVRVGREWYLFDGWTALTKVWKGLPTKGWAQFCAFRFESGSSIAWPRLGAWLRFDLDKMEPHARARAMRLRCRKHLHEVAPDLGWDLTRLLNTELGDGSEGDLNTLLDYWQS